MDYNILELLLNSNPASATALLAVLILFFYNLFKKFDKKAVKMINEHDDAVTKNVDKMNNMILHRKGSRILKTQILTVSLNFCILKKR